jgi:glycosyltransferase involved in cell wall biosynthesis
VNAPRSRPSAPADVVLSIYDDIGNPHYGGGGAVVVGEIAARLAADHRVTVYTGSYRGSRATVRGGVRYVFLPVGWAGPRAGQLLFSLLLPLVARRVRADVWIESLTPPFTASLLPLARRRPVVGLVQMLSAADMARKYKIPFHHVERLGLRWYRRFVVLNETDREAVRACNPDAAIDLIPNGVTRPDPATLRYGDGEHLLYLGRIDVRQKGLDLLLAAVSADSLPLPLVVAGSGTPQEERRLRELAAPAGDRVRVVGRVDGAAKSRLLSASAAVVVPSRFETFSLTALEAMAYGKPVVCFDLPRLAWIGADCAVKVPPFDVDSLRDALRDLVGDPERRAALGRCGRARSASYDWTAIGARYRELVATLAGWEPAVR